MAIGTGKVLLLGLRKASTWATSIIVSHANSTGIRPEPGVSFDEEIEPLVDQSYNADSVARRATNKPGKKLVRFKIPVKAKYDGLDTMLALFFGTAGVPSGGGAPYTHTLYRKIDMIGIFFTLVWYDGLHYHELDSCKFDSLKVTGSPGGVIMYEFGGFGRLRSEDTATNTNLALLVENATIAEVQWLNSIITYQAAATADALAAFSPIAWELNFTQAYSLDIAQTSELIAEPVNGEWTCRGSFTVPHEATTIIAACASGAEYKAKLVHTSGSLQHNFWLPSITWEKWSANPTDKGAIAQKLDWRAEKALSAPSTFPQVWPVLQLLNGNSANPLA